MGKSIFASRTFWLAVVQAVSGVLVAAMIADPNVQKIGWVAVAKSIVDVLLRFGTDTPVAVMPER